MRYIVVCVDGREEVPDGMNVRIPTQFKAWKKLYAITQSTILFAIERSLWQQNSIQKEVKALGYQLKLGYKSKVKQNIWVLPDALTAMKVRERENAYKFAC